MELVIFDLETTGFSPRTHEIIQIAAVRIRHGELVAGERFATFVRPQTEIPSFISDLTGITSTDVRDAPEPAPALLAFSRFVGDATLVAHNGWRFDLGFIRENCQRHQLPTRAVPFFDSMTLSQQLWGSAKSHGLDAVMERLALAEFDHHRHDARGDVALLAAAVRTMWQRLGAPPRPLPRPVGHRPPPAINPPTSFLHSLRPPTLQLKTTMPTCKYCGTKASSISNLTISVCHRHPSGANKGKHVLYEGAEKARYSCKHCGTNAPDLANLTASLCHRHPMGAHKGRHEAAL